VEIHRTVAGPGVAEVTVAGEIDMSYADDLDRALRAAADDDAISEVVVHMNLVRFCDSSGVRALVDGQQYAIDRGKRLWIASLSDQVRLVLRVTAVLDMLTSREAESDPNPPRHGPPEPVGGQP
jgi:anti-anti-sigma factor